MLVPMGFVISVTAFPGFLPCVTGLTLLALMIAVPLVAVALVVTRRMAARSCPWR